ncbi:ead/Ea22-like family protein [Salmonella enterica subsp. enterica]|nr:ead/Ea22-like family protein [Salmonella enterica subsp. enterica]
MSNIDKQALREVAEKATKGPWTLFSDIDTKTFSIHTPRDKRCENVIKWGGFDCQPNAEANAEFIAAFNPKVALALLDELEHYKSREERVIKLVLDNSTSWDALYKKLEAAEKRIAEQREYYEGVIADGSKRIAELEARKVNLPAACADDEYFIDGVFQALRYERDVERAIRAAGIKVKGE